MTIPKIGEPAIVQGLTVLVVVRCSTCGEDLALVNDQPATCPACGLVVKLDSVLWDHSQPRPQIEMSARRPVVAMTS